MTNYRHTNQYHNLLTNCGWSIWSNGTEYNPTGSSYDFTIQNADLYSGGTQEMYQSYPVSKDIYLESRQASGGPSGGTYVRLTTQISGAGYPGRFYIESGSKTTFFNCAIGTIKASCYFRDGDISGTRFSIMFASYLGGANLHRSSLYYGRRQIRSPMWIGNSSWTQYSFYFNPIFDIKDPTCYSAVDGVYGDPWEMNRITAGIAIDNSSVVGNYFDIGPEITISSIAPCCVAADTLAMDTWSKSTNMLLYRNDEESGVVNPNWEDNYFKNTYEITLNTSSTNQYLNWPNDNNYNVECNYSKFRGREVTFGCAIKTSYGSHVCLIIEDSDGSSTSSYHSGGGSYEWLEVSRRCSNSITSFRVRIKLVNNANIAYARKPMLIYGNYIGSEVNWSPPDYETIWFDKPIASTRLTLIGNTCVHYGTAMEFQSDSGSLIGRRGLVGCYVYSEFSSSSSYDSDNQNFILVPQKFYFPLITDQTTYEGSYINSMSGLLDNSISRVSGFARGDKYCSKFSPVIPYNTPASFPVQTDNAFATSSFNFQSDIVGSVFYYLGAEIDYSYCMDAIESCNKITENT